MDIESCMEVINIALNKIDIKLKEQFVSQNIQRNSLKKRKLSVEVPIEHVNESHPSNVNNCPLEENAKGLVPTISRIPQAEHDSVTLKYITGSELSEIIKSEVLSPWEGSLFDEILFSFNSEANIKDSIIKNHALLHSLWQKLHTGHWSEVPITLREAFTWGSIILVGLLLKELHGDISVTSEVSKFMQIKSSQVVLVCDRGLMMGKPIKENSLQEVAALFNKFAVVGDDVFANEALPSQVSSDYIPEETSPFLKMTAVEFQRLPSLQKFLVNYMEKKLPLKIHGIADSWPALQKWNFKYFCDVAGARTVPVEIGFRYSDSDWSQVLMRINDYMKICSRGQDQNGKRAYLAQHQLFDQIPELLSDIVVPDYCHMGENEPVMNAWIGPKGTITPLHHDPDHNILVQVYGYKTLLIYPESDSEFLYAFDDILLNNTSKVNLEEVTKRSDIFEVWPLLKNLHGHYLVLGPGDALYIPPKWWHYVRSLSNSISVSFWWR